MLQSILLLAIVVLAIWTYKRWSAMEETERKRLGKKYVFWGLITILLAMVLTGKTHWLFAVFAAFLALFQRVMQVIQYWPLFKRFFGQPGSSNNQKQNTAPNNQSMTRSQAADLLGIKESATKEEVIAAHRRLMQKVHPDRGGSDALAAQINEAKKVMLG